MRLMEQWKAHRLDEGVFPRPARERAGDPAGRIRSRAIRPPVIRERRAGPELRADGRTLVGPVVRYGEVSPTHRERFEPGSLSPLGDVVLNLGHRRLQALAFGDRLELRDTPEAFMVRARLPRIPAADVALDGVRSGVYTGFSSEFKAREEVRESGIRVIRRAYLVGVGLVESPSYERNTVEVRRRIGRVSGRIPRRKALDCRCADGCEKATIDGEVEVSPTALAIRRGYAEALGSRERGTLKVDIADDAIRVEVGVPDTSYGRDLLAAAEAAPVVIRPVVDFVRSVWERQGTLAIFKKLSIPAFVVGFTDKLVGHVAAKVLRRGRRVWL